MAVLGLLIFGIDLLRGQVKIGHNTIRVFFTGFILTLWGFLVVIINNSDQLLYVEYFISLVSAFCASYFLVKATNNNIKSFNALLWIVVLTVFFESVLTIMMRFMPGFQDLMFSLQEFQTRDVDDQELLNINRFVGLGEAVYFGVLPSCALGQVSLTSLMINDKSPKYTLLYWLIFTVVTVVSFLVARYCLAISLICLVWYLYNLFSKGEYKKIIVVLSVIVLLAVSVFAFLRLFLPEGVFEWAFELLENGSSDTKDNVLDWLINTKFDFKTFVLGDGLYSNKDGSYYGGVDIGLYRQIFYAGIIGLIILFIVHIEILKECKKLLPSKQVRSLSKFMILSFFVIMLKGDKSIFDLLMLLYVFTNYSICQKVISHE